MAASYHGGVDEAPHSALRCYPQYNPGPASRYSAGAWYVMQDTYHSV